jgi:beta-galactosidase
LAGCFGYYDLDGSPTDRSRVAAEVARWTNAPETARLWRARPVRGEVDILVVPEAAAHCYASTDSTTTYYHAVSGVYQGFLFNNIQPEFVHIDDLGPGHDLVYLPYPVMLTEKTAGKVKAWVEQGGRLICEGCPAYFGDRGRIGEQQPNYGLDELFGVKQSWVQFTPDLLEDLTIRMDGGSRVGGGVFLQAYEPTTGTARGTYDDGRVAVVDHAFGQGRTRLIGSFPGYGYYRSQDGKTKRFFADLLKWAEKTPHITSSDLRIIARLQTDGAARFVWVVNSERKDIEAELTLSTQWGPVESCRVHAGDVRPKVKGRVIALTVPARTVAILELR